MLNFRIVDGDDYYSQYDEFVKEYNKGTYQRQIHEKLDLSDKKYRDYLKRAIDEGLVVPRRKKIVERAKYYYKTPNGSYVISHRNPLTEKQEYYGTYHTLEEVEEKVKELMANNWE